MIARRFTPDGLRKFEDFIILAKQKHSARLPVPPVPDELLSDDKLSEKTLYELPDVGLNLTTKLLIGEHFDIIIPEREHTTARLDKALWSWLAARYFDQITKGRTKIKEVRAYVAGITFQEFYRHLLLGPYFLYHSARDNPDRVKVLLYDDPTTMNEVMVQFGSYQTLMQNRELQTVIQTLYYDPASGRIKKGAGGKGPGSPRRLMDFFRQIELNFDLNSISSERFLSMLPSEFSGYLKAPIKG